MAKRLINMMVTIEEDALLVAYAKQEGRTKTEIVREMIRSLKLKPAKRAAVNVTVSGYSSEAE